MRSLQAIQAATSQLPNGPPIVAAIPGGTTSIGSYIAQALATTYVAHGSKLRVYIVGRNAVRAESVIAECRKTSPGSDWRFIHATDLALVSEVDRCCTELVRQETEDAFHGGAARLDMLYMTYSYMPLKKRSTTVEGLDAFLATVYYTRIRFIMQLLPLLTASPLAGSVVSIYAGSFEDGTKPGEFPVGCPSDSEYGTLSTVRKHAVFMKTFLFKELAEKHAGKLRLTHIYPGLVDGPGFTGPEAPRWFRILWRLMNPLLRLVYMTPPDVCGQVMVYLSTARFPTCGAAGEVEDVARSSQGEVGGGAYSVGQRADPQKGIMYEKVRKDDTAKKIWEHTMETLERAEKAGKTVVL